MVIAVLVLIVGLYLLVFSANHLINTSVRIAKHFNVSDLLIWLTILAIWTSAPELFLSWMAAIQWSGSLSIWNIIWSNIFNLWIILWVSAIAAPVVIQKKLVYRDWAFLLWVTALIFIMLRDQHVALREGISLLVLLVWYNAYLIIKKESPTDESIDVSVPKVKNFLYLFLGVALLSLINVETVDWSFNLKLGMDGISEIFVIILFLLFVIIAFRRRIPWAKETSKWMLLNITKLVASIWLLVMASDVIVDAAVFIAQTLWMSQRAIWATIIAAGTSLPELATTITAIVKKKYDMWVANLVWSNIFNTLWIIWVSATIHPIDLTPVCLLSGWNCEWILHFFQDTSFSFMLLFITMWLIVYFMRKDWKISQKEWWILLGVSICVLVFETSPSFFFGLL
jgi:cation:H+ antiporter